MFGSGRNVDGSFGSTIDVEELLEIPKSQLWFKKQRVSMIDQQIQRIQLKINALNH